MSTALTARAVSHAPPLVPPAGPGEAARIAELMRAARCGTGSKPRAASRLAIATCSCGGRAGSALM